MNLNLENYKNIVESLNEGIIILNKNNEILYANKYLLNLLSYNSKDLLDLNFEKLFKKKIYKIIKDSFKTNQNSINNIEIHDKKKTKHFVNITLQNADISDDFDKLIIIDDITKIHNEEVKKSCIYKISEAIHDSDDLESLYKDIRLR